MFLYIIYGIVLVFYTVVSWGFVDPNSLLPQIAWLGPIIYFQRGYPTVWYTGTIIVLFSWYFWLLSQVKKGLVTSKTIWYILTTTIVILFWSFPATSNDIFNYIATAKVIFFHKENPYLVMPIEIPNEPMLTFLNAANKVALYGPFWIALTVLPHYAGGGSLLFTICTFKLFIVGWYVLLCSLIWKISGKKPWNLAFFALNPLVILSTLVDAHNDVVMMALALSGFLALKNKRYVVSVALIILSVLIKGATLFLVPVFLWCIYQRWKTKNVAWQRVWYLASVAMYMVFLLSPLREEVYAWYLIWPLTFLALVDKHTILHAASYGFSFGLMLRVVPFFYTRSWSGMTPIIKKIVTITPPIVSTFLYGKTRHW